MPKLKRLLPTSDAAVALTAMLLFALSTAFSTTMHVAIRKVPGPMHPFEVAFFRNFIGLLYLLGWQSRDGFKGLRTQRLRLHMLRGALNGVTMLAYFQGVIITPLGDVAALGFTAPLFTSLLALLVLREPVKGYRLGAIVVGFAGALVVLRPGFQELTIGPFLLLLSASVWSVVMVLIKMLSRTESSSTIVTYMMLTMTPVTLVAALPNWQWPDATQLAWMALVALCGTGRQVFLSQAFKLTDTTTVLPLEFLKLVWGILAGWSLFAEVPDAFTIVGGAVIFSTTTYLAIRESRDARARQAPAAG